MKLEIDIPYYMFEQIKRENTIKSFLHRIDFAVRNGVEKSHGKWIDLSDGWQEGTYECSNCKTEFVLIEGTPEDNEYNFCPNCGASMVKEEGDEK